MDCADHMAKGSFESGVYNVTINGEVFDVYCDMTTNGGGWTVRIVVGPNVAYLTAVLDISGSNPPVISLCACHKNTAMLSFGRVLHAYVDLAFYPP